MVAENERSKAPVIIAVGILVIAIATTVVAVVGFYETEDDLLPASEPIRHEGLPPGIVAPK